MCTLKNLEKKNEKFREKTCSREKVKCNKG